MCFKSIVFIFSLFCLFSFGFCVKSDEFRLATAIGNHMRSPERAAIWGYSTPSDEVTVHFNGGNYSSKANEVDGRWKVLLPPTEASYNAYTITVTSKLHQNILTVEDILFGDVWFCSGQSNMEMTVKQTNNGSYYINDSVNYPYIRVRSVSETWLETPIDDLNISLYRQNWMVNGPDAIGGEQWTYFSAVCYYYGLLLHKKLNIPMGLFSSPYEGTLIEPWTPPEALDQCSQVQKSKPPQPPNYHPSSLYNAQIHPFLNMTIKGMIWIQGEANVVYNPGDRINQAGYACIFPQMIKYLRKYWSEVPNTTNPLFPFGFVTLTGYSNNGISYKQECNLAELRFSQRAQYPYTPNPHLPNTFSIDSIDLMDSLEPGNPYGPIHWRFKYETAERLSNLALEKVYGLNDLPNAIPVYSGCNIVDNSILSIKINKTLIKSEKILIKNTFGFDVYNNETKKWIQVPILNETSKNDDYAININISSVPSNTISGVRYNWEENPCCPSVYTKTGPYRCYLRECAVYSSKSDLPLPFFRSNITNSRCILEETF